MTPVFCCGFECGQLASGSTVGQHWLIGAGTPTISTSTVRNGARSLRCNPTASTAYVTSPALGSLNTVVTRVAVYFATLPNVDREVATYTSHTGAGLYFKASDSKLYPGYNSGTITFGSTGVTVTTGQWYYIDIKINASTNPWTIDVSVNGATTTQLIRSVAGQTTSDNLLLGFIGGSTTADVFYDDVVISLTGVDYPIGDGYVNHFVPTADGTHNIAGAADFGRTLTGTDILNATTTAYQLVDDVPLESGASVDWINLIAPPNVTDYVECIFGAASGISTPTVAPRAVEVIAGIHQAGTGTGNMAIRLNDNGTTDDVYTATTVAGTTTVIYKRKHYAAGPAGAWTVAAGAGNFNNIRMRFGSPAAVDANPDQYLDCIMIEAEFAAVVLTPSIPNKIYSYQQAVRRASYW